MAAIYTYWISTALLSLLYLSSAFLYLTKGDWVRQEITKLGYPVYLVPLIRRSRHACSVRPDVGGHGGAGNP